MAKIVDMSKHFRTRDLLKYTAPAMAMMLFTSIYGIVDGFFVSNYAGKTAFAAVNLVMPFIMILGTVGFMAGTGGSALVASARGEGDDERANRWFSTIVWAAFILGVIMAVLGAVLMEPVARALGASEDMLPICVLYGRISMISLPAFILQFAFQAFFSTAGKPNLGLGITIASGMTNIVLDFLLVGAFGWGVVGAAVATVMSEFVGGFIPLGYFASYNNGSALKLHRPHADWGVLGKTCINGSSEMMSSIAMNVVSVLYNMQLMTYIGEDGVSAYGVIMYAGMMFGAILEGYNMGAAPLMSYQHGAENNVEKRSLYRHGVGIMEIGGLIMLIAAELLAPAVATLFVGYNQALYDLTIYAFRVYALCLVLVGFNMFGSALFTSLGNGQVSALIAFVRTLVFECGAVMLLPMLVGVDGIWFSVVIAEVASALLVIGCLAKFGRRYGLFASRN